MPSQADVRRQSTPVGACCWRHYPAAKAASAHQTHYSTAAPGPAVSPAEHWKLPWQLPALPALLVLQIKTLALVQQARIVTHPNQLLRGACMETLPVAIMEICKGLYIPFKA